jgi:cell fate (sporulation/competence/biofilm development) regulator YmcA (YheA/YmcA/DUF963 family)
MKKTLNDIEDVSNSVSFFALLALAAVFLVIVTYGWAMVLQTVISIPQDWIQAFSPLFLIARYLVAFFIAVAGVVLGKAIAAERIRINSEKAPKFTNTWKAYLVVLLVISSLGTMNALFMGTQQTSVLTEAISHTRNSLQKLRFKIDEKLSTPSYDQQRVDINNLLALFAKELKNPANCGFGAQSLQRFKELQAALPKLKPLALGSGACQNVDAIIGEYRETVMMLVDDLPDSKTKKRYQQRAVLTLQIDKSIAAIEDLKIKTSVLNKDAVLPILKTAWRDYGQTLKEAELLSGSEFGLPAEIVNENIQEMGNITEILPMLIKRFDNPMTYVIVLAATFVDILLIMFFERHLHGRVRIREEFFSPGNSPAVSNRVSNLFDEQR